MREHVHRVVTDDAHVRQLLALEAEQQASDTGLMHFDTQIVADGIALREPRQQVAVAEADLETTRCTPAKDGIEVERAVAVFDAVTRPQLLERARLAGREAALPAHEAADLAVADVFRHGATVRIFR